MRIMNTPLPLPALLAYSPPPQKKKKKKKKKKSPRHQKPNKLKLLNKLLKQLKYTQMPPCG